MPLWVLYAILSAIAAALVAVFGKLGVSAVDSTLATTVRAIIMAVFLIIVSFVLGKFEFLNTFNSKVFTFVVLSGIAGAVSWLFYFLALKTGPVSGVVALDRLSVVFALLLAIAFLGERLTIRSGIGAVLVFVGAILLSIK